MINNKNARCMFAFLTGLALSTMLPTAWAADIQLEKSVQQGKDTFSHNTFGGNGRVCESCHLSGGRELGKLPNGQTIPSLNNAAAVFPRFNPKANKVVTLADQVRNCIAGALQGNPPAYGSEKLNALISYVTSLSQGKPMDMGGKPQ